MRLALVLGPVVSNIKHPSLIAEKILALQPVNNDLEPDGKEMVAVDKAQAGKGDLVLVLREGGSARKLIGKGLVPIRSVVVGVVDRVDIC
ncbi:MAG: EutN/CcmL family microcompartment protein [bacterium]|nr:EutN/CcmL family microcompartment protein [bacterium]